MHLVPKSWAKFQHYKDRSPPWIKFHRVLLNNRDFMCLPLASKAIAPLLWLLASESKDGSFNADLDELEFRLRISKKDIAEGLKPLIDKGFFVDASGMLAQCLQDAIPETERESEKETETKAKKETKRSQLLATPDGVSPQVWSDWLALRKAKRAPVTQTVVDGAIREAEKAGMTLEAFLQVWCRRGSQGLEASWLKPDERQQATETTYQRSMRLRMQEAVPEIAKREPTPNEFFDSIDVQALEVKNEPTYRLG